MKDRADIRIVHIEEANCLNYKAQVTAWLSSDFLAKGQPSKHFYHNLDTIREYFDKHQAIVAVNHKDEAIGYFLWNQFDQSASVYLSIVEVKKTYRRQGILRRMLALLSDSHPEFCLIYANNLSDDGQGALTKLGWHPSILSDHPDYYLKSLQRSEQALEHCPKQGPVLALHHTQKRHGPIFKTTYYRMKFDSLGQLTMPIITPFYNDGTCSIYFNGRSIIKEVRIKHLFVQRPVNRSLQYLALMNIMPKDRAPFDAVGFFQDIPHSDEIDDGQPDLEGSFESPVSHRRTAQSGERAPSRKRSDYSVTEGNSSDGQDQAAHSRKADAEGARELKRSCQ